MSLKGNCQVTLTGGGSMSSPKWEFKLSATMYPFAAN